MSGNSQMANQMEGQRLFERYSQIPYQQFSATLFEQELKRLTGVFSEQGRQLIQFIDDIDTRFNRTEIEKLVKSSKNSDQLVSLLRPYLQDFEQFANKLFPMVSGFFAEIENSEAILHGFQFRFMLDLATIFDQAQLKDLYLLDLQDSDFKSFERLASKVFKENDTQTRKLVLESMMATPKRIEEEIVKSRKKSIFNFFLSNASKRGYLSQKYSEFIQAIREDLEDRLKRQPFIDFDKLRVSIYTDIANNKIQLNFIKKLQEYIIYLEKIEALIFNLENRLMFLFIEFNKKIIGINQKVSEFINYILNEDKFTTDLREMVKHYLHKSESVKKSITSFVELERTIQLRVQELDSHLVALMASFKDKVREAQAQNQQHATQILQNRL